MPYVKLYLMTASANILWLTLLDPMFFFAYFGQVSLRLSTNAPKPKRFPLLPNRINQKPLKADTAKLTLMTSGANILWQIDRMIDRLMELIDPMFFA